MAATAQQLLDAVNDALLKLLTHTVAEYKINNVAYTYQDIAALRRLRTELESEVARTSGDRPAIVHADISRRPA